jgi:hypothetical protein
MIKLRCPYASSVRPEWKRWCKELHPTRQGSGIHRTASDTLVRTCSGSPPSPPCMRYWADASRRPRVRAHHRLHDQRAHRDGSRPRGAWELHGLASPAWPRGGAPGRLGRQQRFRRISRPVQRSAPALRRDRGSARRCCRVPMFWNQRLLRPGLPGLRLVLGRN